MKAARDVLISEFCSRSLKNTRVGKRNIISVTNIDMLNNYRNGMQNDMKPIWIVDDDDSIRWVLEKALARENLATRSFTNARDAMTALQSDMPQVLVSDIRMHGASGLELLVINIENRMFIISSYFTKRYQGEISFVQFRMWYF